MNLFFTTKQGMEKGGFTLIETLVSVFILSLAIVVPMTIASRTLFSSVIARDQVTASYLAQEAIEAVRSVRDQNRLANVTWDTDFPAKGSNFTIDVVNINAVTSKPTMTLCSGACVPINYDSSTHLYQYSAIVGTNAATSFIRTVRLDSIPTNANEMAVTVTVSWNVGSNARTFTTRENLLNWQN